MARETRKPKKDKKLKDGPEPIEEGEEGEEEDASPDDEEGLKPFVAYFDLVPDDDMDDAVEEEIKALLRRLRSGESLSLLQSRPMPDIGARCHELRVTEGDGIWRIFYRTDADAIRSSHVLWKTTQKTPPAAIKLSKSRFKKIDALLAQVAAEKQRLQKKS